MSDGDISENYDDDFAYQGFPKMPDLNVLRAEAVKALEDDDEQNEEDDQN